VSIDVKFSVGFLLGALLVFGYWKYCEKKMAG
jgi:hypothetical protein